MPKTVLECACMKTAWAIGSLTVKTYSSKKRAPENSSEWPRNGTFVCGSKKKPGVEKQRPGASEEMDVWSFGVVLY